MRNLTRYGCVIALAVGISGQAQSANVNVVFDPTTTVSVKQVNPFATFWEMGQTVAPDNIRVTGFFSAGAPHSAPFLSLADPCGGALGRFELTGCGDTGFNPWVLQNNDFANSGYLERVDIDLLRGGFVFDVDAPSPGTPNSQQGTTFALAPDNLGPDDVINVTYSRQVAKQADAPLGDIWGYMSIDLTGIISQGGLGLRDTISFEADTDPIPVPAALPLLCSALAGLALLRRRFNSAS